MRCSRAAVKVRLKSEFLNEGEEEEESNEEKVEVEEEEEEEMKEEEEKAGKQDEVCVVGGSHWTGDSDR